jgi:adenylate cyclase
MNLFRKLLRFPPVPICFISILCFCIVIGLQRSGSLENIELTAYDWFVRSRPKLLDNNPRILIIKISEDDILTQGKWPLTDETLAKALKQVLKYTPRAIGLDIFRDIPIPPGTDELNHVLSSNPHIICVTKFGHGGVPPPPILKGTGQVGFNDMLVDPGGIIRRGLLFLDNGKEVFYSFNLLLALNYLQYEGITAGADEDHPEYLKLGQTTIKPLEQNDGGYINADARGYQYFIDFKDNVDFHTSYSLTQLLSGQIDPNDIRDKIVFIGVVSNSVKDHFYTPFSRGVAVDQQLPGVILHARLTSQLIRFGMNENLPIKTIADKPEFVFMLFWSLLGSIAGFFIRSFWRFFLMISGGFFLLCFSLYFAFLSGWWIPLVPPGLVWALSAGLTTAYLSGREKRQRAVLMQLFSKHVSHDIAASIWKQRDEFLQNGRPKPQKMTVSILFSDIRGFTAISKILDPQVLIQWLNIYMEAMTDTVIAHGGVVDDYAGDGIKANFGVPFPRVREKEIGEDAKNAVTCAIAMGKEIERLNVVWKQQGLPTGGTRIGIFTGSVVAGALGSSQRMKYTTVGDIVNTAARLESYDKELAKGSPWRVLVGDVTQHYLNGQFNTKKIGEADLKGKNEKIKVYRVFSKKKEPIQEQ